jgi:AcrR family transcriptional regulator
VYNVNMSAGKTSQVPAAEPSGAYHHGKLRPALVEQGLALLENSPQGELSLRELARQVGVSANATYRHFANKEALLAALAAEGFRRMQAAQVHATLGAPDLKTGFRQAGRAYVRFAQDHPALFRLMFGGLLANHPSEELEQAGQSAFATLQTAVAQLLGIDDVCDHRVTVSAMTAWSVVHGLSHLALDRQLEHHGGQADALIDEVLERFGSS